LLASAVPRAAGEDWLGWGGPRGDFVIEPQGIAERWPESGPKQLWKRPLGDGYSSILCKGDTLFTAYHDQGHEVVIALDARTGSTRWEHRQKVEFWKDMTRQFGPGPNATPLLMGGRLMHIGIDGRMRCLDALSGKLLWEKDLPGQFGRRKRIEEYGYSGSPLAYRDTAIVLVGGDAAAVVALNPADGNVVWGSESGGVSYAPAAVLTLAGVEQYIYFEPMGVVALDPGTGSTLWRSPIQFNNGNHLTTAVKCDESSLWVGSQFTTGGGRLLKLTRANGDWKVERAWFNDKLQATHTPWIREGDYVYGSIGFSTWFFCAVNWKTGEIAWRERGHTKAQLLHVDGKLLFVDEDGKLVLARFSPEKFEVLSTVEVTESVSWTVPTLVSKVLFLRDR
jgi:outer membrane protein assembly factor BamB